MPALADADVTKSATVPVEPSCPAPCAVPLATSLHAGRLSNAPEGVLLLGASLDRPLAGQTDARLVLLLTPIGNDTVPVQDAIVVTSTRIVYRRGRSDVPGVEQNGPAIRALSGPDPAMLIPIAFLPFQSGVGIDVVSERNVGGEWMPVARVNRAARFCWNTAATESDPCR